MLVRFTLVQADKGLLEEETCKQIKSSQVDVEQQEFAVPSVVDYQWHIYHC